MSLRDFNQITLCASKFWENQFKTQNEQSTQCSLDDHTQSSLIEIAAQKIEQKLFPENETQLKENQSCLASESEDQECIKQKIDQQEKTNIDEHKNEITSEEKNQILDSIRNVVQPELKCHINLEFFSKLQKIKNGNDYETTMLKTQKLIKQIEFLQNSNTQIESDQKIKELKLIIEKMENHLDETKKLILQTYLSQ